MRDWVFIFLMLSVLYGFMLNVFFGAALANALFFGGLFAFLTLFFPKLFKFYKMGP